MPNHPTPIIFTGQTREYFGIWIVNLLLSVVTLGIYSAWAKVRRKKYFYNHTLVDGVGFDYHAKPIAILKGRAIAFILFVLFQSLGSFNPIVSLVLGTVLFLLVPWIIVRGMLFNARNSSYRGVRFDFKGRTKDAIKLFIAYPALILFSLGLALPFVKQRTHRFIFNHHQFGLTQFRMQASVKKFYGIYLKLFGAILAIVLLLSLLVFGSLSALKPFNPAPVKAQATSATAVETKTAQENSKDHSKENKSAIETMLAALNKMLGKLFNGAFLVGLLFYALVIFSIRAFTQSRIQNLMWNSTSLAHVGFMSDQRMRDLMALYLTNTVALVLTLGLATPWVQIRMAHYRAKHLQLTGEQNWQQFIGEKKEAARAMGEEMADMFDVDISFG